MIIQESSHVPFGTGPTRPVQLHSGAIVTPRKFHGGSNMRQVYAPPECRAECGTYFCNILQLMGSSPGELNEELVT